MRIQTEDRKLTAVTIYLPSKVSISITKSAVNPRCFWMSKYIDGVHKKTRSAQRENWTKAYQWATGL